MVEMSFSSKLHSLMNNWRIKNVCTLTLLNMMSSEFEPLNMTGKHRAQEPD